MASPAILLLDDGELDDIRSLLGELPVEFASLRGNALEGVDVALPDRLLVATGRCALKVHSTEGTGSRPVRIAVLEEDSGTLRARLAEQGFDYLVRRPVHPVALRLLLLRALYRGDEKRVSERVPIGARVSYRIGVWRRSALLAELSTSGCRLLTPRASEPDTAITVRLAKELTGDEPLVLSGWVVRCERDAWATAELPFATAVAFELPPRETEERLQAFLRGRARGPETISEKEAERATATLRPGRRARLELGSPRAHFRRSPRRPFRSRVVAIHHRHHAMRVLVGRNLSTGGMQVEAHPGICHGDRLSLALFGGPGQRILLRAEVARDDDEAGLTLRFLDPSPEATKQIEALIAALPRLERIDGPGPLSVASVVGEIASHEAHGRLRRAS